MRGKLRCCCHCVSPPRITPAGAGKTDIVGFGFDRWKDHPRGCGENAPAEGSVVTYSRITPADAGKTYRYCTGKRIFWDHPRGCGENIATILSVNNTAGSPPRLRGKLPPCAHCLHQKRITPADAGKTCLSMPAAWAARDHPRGCGENTTSDRKTQCRAGSPPQVRGKLAIQIFSVVTPGITPAGAGKTDYNIKKSL